MRIDKDTLSAFKNGRMKEFEKIYRLYNSRVYGFICSMINDRIAAKDLAQDVFLQIWDKRSNIDSEGNFEGYLFTITKNTVYLHLRRELLLQSYISTQTTELEKKEPEREPEAEKMLDNKLLEENILKLVKELPQARREVFLLYWKSQMTYKEIAGVLDISEKTVATQVHRTLQFLRERLNKTLLLTLVYYLSAPF